MSSGSGFVVEMACRLLPGWRRSMAPADQSRPWQCPPSSRVLKVPQLGKTTWLQQRSAPRTVYSAVHARQRWHPPGSDRRVAACRDSSSAGVGQPPNHCRGELI